MQNDHPEIVQDHEKLLKELEKRAKEIADEVMGDIGEREFRKARESADERMWRRWGGSG